MATAVYEAGPKKVVRALEVFMVAADAAGQLNCPDPGQAAEFFASMVVGMRQIDRLLGATLESLEPQFEHVAREAALHFCPWYSKAPRRIAVASAFGSALGWAKMKSFPPVSPTRRG